MFNILINIIKLIRVKQWIKNLFVFVPLLFSFSFVNFSKDVNVLLCFILFCIVSSIIYIVNDLIDKEKDILHPVKRFRPLASGVISSKTALGLICGGGTTALLGSAIMFSRDLALVNYVIFLYLILNILYSFKLKNIVLLDVFVIAFGFLLRVYAGAFACGVPVSDFLLLTTLFLSLFLGFSKRKFELYKSDISRTVLKNYSIELTNQFVIISAGLTIMCYTMYTLEPVIIKNFAGYMVYSVIFVIYGIFQYLLITNRDGIDDPTENLYSDKGMIVICFLYVIYIGFVIWVAGNV